MCRAPTSRASAREPEQCHGLRRQRVGGGQGTHRLRLGIRERHRRYVANAIAGVWRASTRSTSANATAPPPVGTATSSTVPGHLRTTLNEAETYWSMHQRARVQCVPSRAAGTDEFRHFQGGWRQNIPISRVFTCAVAAAQLEWTSFRLSITPALREFKSVKVADLDSDGRWHSRLVDARVLQSPTARVRQFAGRRRCDGTGQDNAFRYVAGLNPQTRMVLFSTSSVRTSRPETICSLHRGWAKYRPIQSRSGSGIWTQLTGFAGQ